MSQILKSKFLFMERLITSYLLNWKNRTNRKPLILRGARQVGKTYTVESFGKNHYSEFIQINFEETPEIKLFFTTNNVVEIIQNLEIYLGKKISAPDTLLFLDEIQTCPEAIVTLRYFFERLPELHVVAAGSLLDHTLNDLQYPMPVGRVEFAYMYPMNFYEFLHALGEHRFVDFLNNFILGDDIPLPFHNKLMELIRLFYRIGGMPEAVKNYIETRSLIDVQRIHESIIRSLEFDFSKYGTKSQQSIMSRLLNYIPKVIGQKFKYVNFDNNIRSDSIRRALELLHTSRIIHLIHNTKANTIPLKHGINDKVFKPILLDIGLLNHMLKLPVIFTEDIHFNHEGALAEQFIGQELINSSAHFMEQGVYYWTREKRNAEAEIDYLLESQQQIVPIEVKAGKSGTLKSLQIFVLEKNLDKAIRFNADLPSTHMVETSIKISKDLKRVNFKLISLPFYLVGEFSRFI